MGMSSASSGRSENDGFGIQSRRRAGPGRVDGEGFLIVKDCNSWNGTANVDALDEAGYSYGVESSDRFQGMSLEGYHTIVIPSTQGSGYYRNLAEAKDKLASFVEDGGTLIGHVTDDGRPCTAVWEDRFLPGSIAKTTEYLGDLRATDDVLFDGLEEGDLDNWNYSAHGYFTRIPADAEVLAETESGGDPTYVRYSHGEGTVLATMQTVEWPWTADGRSNVPDVSAGKELLRNEFQFAAGEGGPDSDTVSIDVDVLSFIPGESENSTRGGNPFNSAVSQFLPEDLQIEMPLNPALLPAEAVIDLPDFISPKLKVDTTPLFDNWVTGDMILSDNYPDDLDIADNPRPSKYEELGSSSAPIFRTRNGLEVEFEVNEDETIDESTVEVRFQGRSTESVLEQEEVNTLNDDVGDDDEYTLEGGYRDRYYTAETTTIDGTEAVRVATVFGGYSKVPARALDLLSERGEYAFLSEVLDWDIYVDYGPIEVSPDIVLSHLSGLIGGITTALAAVPNIYSHLEVTVLADGRRFVRLWDHSPFPEHVAYVDGGQEFFHDFPDEEGDLRELLSPEFAAFAVGAIVGRGPYYGSKNQYLDCVSEGDCPFDVEEIIGDLIASNPALAGTPYVDELTELALEALAGSRDPVWSYGYDDTETYDAEEVESVLPDDVLDPFDNRESHVGRRQITEQRL